MINKLGKYLFERICNDQERLSRKRPRNLYGLYINEKDLQIDRLSKMALEDPSTNGNPKKLSIEDMKIMYQHSMSGNLF